MTTQRRSSPIEHVDYYHKTREAFERQQQFDVLKWELWHIHGVKLIEIPSIGDILNAQEVRSSIVNACHRQGIILPSGYETRAVDLQSVFVQGPLAPMQLTLW